MTNRLTVLYLRVSFVSKSKVKIVFVLLLQQCCVLTCNSFVFNCKELGFYSLKCMVIGEKNQWFF